MPVASVDPPRGGLGRHEGRSAGTTGATSPSLSGGPQDQDQAPVAPDTRPPGTTPLELRTPAATEPDPSYYDDYIFRSTLLVSLTPYRGHCYLKIPCLLVCTYKVCLCTYVYRVVLDFFLIIVTARDYNKDFVNFV
eukprot:SAG31_NODE_855_length_11461_cov_5.496215_9_plen_136_part_00